MSSLTSNALLCAAAEWAHIPEADESGKTDATVRALLRRMLDAAPEKRYTLEQVLAHPWLLPQEERWVE